MTGTYMYNGEAQNFNFYTNLSSADKLRFVNSVVDLLVSDKNYNFIIRDLIFDFFIIDIFSDIDTTELIESSSFIDDVERFLEESNIVDIIKANANYGVIDELNNAVDLSIEYRTGIHTNLLNNALASLVSTIENKINNIDLDNMMHMAQKFAGMTGELTTEGIVNAYINSDIHKKNVGEIEEFKRQRVEFVEDMNSAIDAAVN